MDNPGPRARLRDTQNMSFVRAAQRDVSADVLRSMRLCLLCDEIMRIIAKTCHSLFRKIETHALLARLAFSFAFSLASAFFALSLLLTGGFFLSPALMTT